MHVWLQTPDDPTKIYCALNEYNKITCIDLTKNPEDSGFETDVCGIQGQEHIKMDTFLWQD